MMPSSQQATRSQGPEPSAPDGRAPARSMIRGGDPALLRALAIAERAAASECSVLILGETGTGKELLARAIHEASPRADHPFVALNCGAIPTELVESELFGHERGAFTGATEPRDGVFLEASGGTLFLDEIGELPRAQQPHLLRALETGRVRRVGGRGERRADARIVAATHQSADLGHEGSALRLDLYHRLATIVVELPPLRQRKRDIPLLVRALLDELAPIYGRRTISPAAMQALLDYPWPGNVRELRHAIERAVVLCDDELSLDMLLPAQRARYPTASRPCATSRAGEVGHYELALRAAMRDAYMRHGSVRGAARALGMPRSTFSDRARRFGILHGGASAG
jgi:two-component system, NtrC family, response regulator HydG